MRPELFSIPFLNLSIKSYGLMMVVGFLAGVLLARHRCRKRGENPDHITNFGVWALLAGVVGARLMHVLHNWPLYRQHPGEMFAIWSGGLEFLGGFVLAVVVFVVYFRRKKLPMLKFLDILAPAVMLGLAFGRIGCLLNGCCFGAVCDLPWAIQFPAVSSHVQPAPGCQKHTETTYSIPYEFQLYPDPDHPDQPSLLQLPPDYYVYIDGNNDHADDSYYVGRDLHHYRFPKPVSELTPEQLDDLKNHRFPMHPIHPSQIYSSLNALLLCVILSFAFHRQKRPGQTFSLLLVLYGLTRFLLEMIRTEPRTITGLTISQNLGLLAALVGLIALAVLTFRPQPDPIAASAKIRRLVKHEKNHRH